MGCRCKWKTIAGLAQVAMQGGAYAAKAILRRIKNQPELPPFHYFDKGSLAVIGRAAAVADVFGLHISGFLAWLVWAFIHVTYLVSFQSRILVFIQWAIQDLTFNRGARLITGAAPTDFNFSKELSEIKHEPVNAHVDLPAPVCMDTDVSRRASMPVRLALAAACHPRVPPSSQDCAASALHNPIQSIGCFQPALDRRLRNEARNILIVTFLVIEARRYEHAGCANRIHCR